MAKCKHGFYIPQFCKDKSPYCSACNPHVEADRPLRLALSKKQRRPKPEQERGEIDAAEFIEQPAGARLDEMRGRLEAL